MPERMIAERPLTPEQIYRLRDEIRLTKEPFIQMLVDVYGVSLPTITIADGVIETTYAPEVELQAEKIRAEMSRAVDMVVRYRSEGVGRAQL